MDDSIFWDFRGAFCGILWAITSSGIDEWLCLGDTNHPPPCARSIHNVCIVVYVTSDECRRTRRQAWRCVCVRGERSGQRGTKGFWPQSRQSATGPPNPLVRGPNSGRCDDRSGSVQSGLSRGREGRESHSARPSRRWSGWRPSSRSRSPSPRPWIGDQISPGHLRLRWGGHRRGSPAGLRHLFPEARAAEESRCPDAPHVLPGELFCHEMPPDPSKNCSPRRTRSSRCCVPVDSRGIRSLSSCPVAPARATAPPCRRRWLLS